MNRNQEVLNEISKTLLDMDPKKKELALRLVTLIFNNIDQLHEVAMAGRPEPEVTPSSTPSDPDSGEKLVQCPNNGCGHLRLEIN